MSGVLTFHYQGETKPCAAEGCYREFETFTFRKDGQYQVTKRKYCCYYCLRHPKLCAKCKKVSVTISSSLCAKCGKSDSIKVPIVCEYCENTVLMFPSIAKGRKYCGEICYLKSNKIKRRTCIQENCNEHFLPWNSKQQYCSNSCASRSRGKDPSKWIIKQCEFCRNEYSIRHDREITSRFCSKRCRHLGDRTNPNTTIKEKEEIKKELLKIPVRCTAEGCNNEFQRTHALQLYCSTYCKMNPALCTCGNRVSRKSTECSNCHRNRGETSYKKCCRSCLNFFTTLDNRQKYCSRKCYNSAKNKRHPFICQQCGKWHTPKQAGARKYCSKMCAGKAVKKPKSVKTCIQCGTGFVIHQSKAKNNYGKFCSTKCRGKYQSSNVIGKQHPMYSSHETSCGICGTIVVRKNSAFTRNKSFLCGKSECKAAYASHTNSGERNWNWRGGPSPYPPEWTKSLRLSIRIRDEYRCALCQHDCFNDKRQPDVHHINGDKQNCDKSNLITLCRSCHRIVESAWHKPDTRLFYIQKFQQHLYELGEKKEVNE